MTDVTHILSKIETGNREAAEQLLPLVYEELRKLAAVRLAEEKPGQTLQATALVHEAYLRLVGEQQFDSRGHFFAAAAEAPGIVVEVASAAKLCSPSYCVRSNGHHQHHQREKRVKMG